MEIVRRIQFFIFSVRYLLAGSFFPLSPRRGWMDQMRGDRGVWWGMGWRIERMESVLIICIWDKHFICTIIYPLLLHLLELLSSYPWTNFYPILLSPLFHSSSIPSLCCCCCLHNGPVYVYNKYSIAIMDVMLLPFLSSSSHSLLLQYSLQFSTRYQEIKWPPYSRMCGA